MRSAVPVVAALLLAAGISAAGVSAPRSAPARKPAPASAARTRTNLEKRLTTTVQPYLKTYCVSCHGKVQPQAQLDLSSYGNLAAVVRDYAHWGLVLEKLHAKEMPPAGTKQPPAALTGQVMAWVQEMRKYEAERNAGDPGLVLARRLSNAEYDYTIRDLTGHDLRPTREFPVDPANQEGFDNTGESLTVSPALMKKYMQAARTVADHVVLKSDGLTFAPHPALVVTDRDKYSILRIVDFYKKQPTDYADYFHAAWRYRHRAALGKPKDTLASVAAAAKISPRYLELIWATLTEAPDKVGPIAKLQALWNALPAPEGGSTAKARAGCEAMREFVTELRPMVASRFPNLQLPGFSPGGQWNLLWKDRQYAAHRRTLNPEPLQIGGQPQPASVDPRHRPRRRPRNMNQPPANDALMDVEPDLFVPADEKERAPYLDSFQRFCSVFPDAFYIAERGRMEFYDPNDRGRLLSAGFHNMMGYFRDDQPLMELILDEQGRKELDRLWVDFDFVARVPERMHLEFIFYERAEAKTITDHAFDFARSEDKEATTDAKIRRLAEVYLGKARTRVSNPAVHNAAIEAMEDHFRRTSAKIRAIEKIRAAAEPLHLQSLLDFTRRAYRRPLTSAEREDLLDFYRTLREKEGLTHEDAIRDTVVSVLMSPKFLFRLDLEEMAAVPDAGVRSGGTAKTVAATKTPATTKTAPAARQSDGTVVKPLSDYALASRLSYFLWSSAPDEELLARAAAGELRRPEVLAAQARRMLKDPRVRRLAVEFGANWLDFRRFEEHNGVDRERFPSFTDELRQAMFEEPVRFLMDSFQQDRPLLDLLYGKHTFVNAALARHYGMKDVKVAGDDWVRVDDAERHGRGGLLPMSVFLTQNSSGLRTSPVKRGYWVVRKVLGEHIPPPPPTVAELPKDEGQLGDKTLRQVLAKHREDPACAGCHARFDSYGLVFEGYGPIGDQRTRDLGGKPVDASAPFPGGRDRVGLAGLREFLREKRQADFVNNFTRKLFSYSLSRGLQASDDPFLEKVQQELASDGYRLGALVEKIVTSKQFRYRRAAPALVKN